MNRVVGSGFAYLRSACSPALLMFFMYLLTTFGPDARAQFEPAADQEPLATKQEVVRDRMAQLEDQVFRLIQQLEQERPEQSKKLQAALEQARQQLIRHRMEQTAELLEDEKLTEASTQQTEIIANLEHMLRTLLEEPDRTAERQKHMDELEAHRQAIYDILNEQKQLQQQSRAQSQPAGGSDLSKKQASLSQEAKQLAERMGRQEDAPSKSTPDSKQQQAEQSDPEDESATRPADQSKQSESDESQQQQQTPGQRQVDQAGKHMQKAAQQMQQGSPQQADGQQQEAINQLEEALEELQETLQQLRQEQQEEQLRSLQSRFRSMLARQLAINTRTKELDDKGQRQWTHADELAVAELAQGEADLTEQAAQALRILEEDATTVLIPVLVEQLRDDLQSITSRLEKRKTGPATQQRQSLVAETLTELLDAVKQAQQQMRQRGQSQEGGGQRPESKLVPDSAELKLLRTRQKSLNERTKKFHEQAGDPAQATDVQTELLQELGRQQQRLAELARRMYEQANE
jgi:hypothetical protein